MQIQGKLEKKRSEAKDKKQYEMLQVQCLVLQIFTLRF